MRIEGTIVWAGWFEELRRSILGQEIERE